MDVGPFLAIQPAPRAVFARLATHHDRPRFHVRQGGAWHPVTWGEFARHIRGIARWLVEHDVAPGDRVAILGESSVAWASAALGVQTAGAVFVPIYAASTAEQIAYILDHAEIRWVFVAGAEPRARLDRARATLPRALEIVDLVTGAAALAAAAERDAHECSIIPYQPPSIVGILVWKQASSNKSRLWQLVERCFRTLFESLSSHFFQRIVLLYLFS